MTSKLEILGLGCVAVDDLLYVPSYPEADTKMRIDRSERQCGGLAATALVAASRLGSKCAYAGTLGGDELSQFVIDSLQRENVDTKWIRRRPGVKPIHSMVIVDTSRQTRTIIYSLDDVLGAQDDWPDSDSIRSARVLIIDHFGSEGMIRAARIARDAGVAVVADFESDKAPGFSELLCLVDHLVISREFACKLTQETDPVTATAKLWSPARQAVVITCGSEGCWFSSADLRGRTLKQPAFRVDVVDTTGCGDVFHGAYASALVRGLALKDRVCFASAAAALKATRPGGQAGCPTLAEVESFLKERGS
jgi:sugar/nucleoside kinase (ribokinase family)